MLKSRLLAASILLAGVFGVVSCSKDDDNSNDPAPEPICIVTGSYVGTSTVSNGPTTPMAYVLDEDNFIYGGENLTAAPISFGSYSNTCDSIMMRSYYTVNNNFYSFEGRFSNNRATITGVYKNLSVTSETGTFTLTRR